MITLKKQTPLPAGPEQIAVNAAISTRVVNGVTQTDVSASYRRFRADVDGKNVMWMGDQVVLPLPLSIPPETTLRQKLIDAIEKVLQEYLDAEETIPGK